MINRELIRLKIVQLVYAYSSGGNKPMDIAVRELDTSLTKANDLYYHLLNLMVVITKEERMRHELGVQKAQREGTPPPSSRFADNRFIAQLEENETLLKFLDTHRHDWSNDIEYVRKLCDIIEQTDIYAAYIASDEDNYENDREIWRKIYKQLLTDNDELDSLLEEKSLYWNDDKATVDSFIIKTIKHFSPETGAAQDLLPEYKDLLDRKFSWQLFCAAIDNKDEYRQYIKKNAQNWDLTRISFMDLIIMQIAIAEMMTFPEIPLNVTINEYIELSKIYSTPKSGTFVNAVLDSVARSLIEEGKLLKQMN